MDKEKYMQRCIQLAKNGKILAAPNPMVGAVIIHNDCIIGEGYHRKSGTPHAEVNAINSVKDKTLLKESTIFVSLEPCSHTGKTPPCADLIIRCGIPRVIIGCQDPFGKVNGHGIQKLKDAGIDVEVGILETECIELIHRFYTFQKYHRPYIILKWAQSQDGFIDILRESGNPVKLSTPLTSLITQKRRAEVASILVGTNTARLDNPQLNVRSWYKHDPIRIVLDRTLSLSKDLNLFDGSIETLIFTEKEDQINQINTTYLTIDFNRNIIEQINNELYKRNIQSILIEGGSLIHQYYLDNNIWDEIQIEECNITLENGVKAASAPKMTESHTETSFGHNIKTLFNRKNK